MCKRCSPGIRTDLDSFSDCEADALMLSGYLMARAAFPNCIRNFPVSVDRQGRGDSPRSSRSQASETETPDLKKLLAALEIAAGYLG